MNTSRSPDANGGNRPRGRSAPRVNSAARSEWCGSTAPPGLDPVLSDLVGRSAAFTSMVQMTRRLAACDTTVLIQGETGTGKERVARALHYLSGRRDAPFIPVNSGAIPESLIESEFFGHSRGAFTDARDARAGLIHQAQGGTLFLDEIETLSARGQVALLRFLEDGTYRAVGGNLTCEADVRIVSASNVDLDVLARAGTFRSDLIYRLDVLRFELPPLRERGDDSVLLAQEFVSRFSRRYGKPLPALAPGTVDFLREHRWPGNVRQLENLVHRAVFLCDGPVIDLRAVAAGAKTGSPAADPLTGATFREAKAYAIARFERAYVSEVLARARGNITLAARIAGKERSRLTKLVKKHGLDRDAFARSD